MRGSERMKLIGLFVVLVLIGALFFGLIFGLEFVGLQWYGFFGPKRAAVQREVFENTVSYVAGVATDLAKNRREYLLSDNAAEKKILANYIFAQYANFDADKLENRDLRNFLKDIQDGKTPR